jgi:hypothetical protein
MRFVRTALIAGIASAALAGAAVAARDEARMMLVALPDGSVHQVPYQEATAPRILLVPVAQPVGLFEAAFGPGSPFADMERLSAAMDAQAEAMMRQAAMLQAQGPATATRGVTLTDAQGQPVGVMHYSYVSSTTSANGCTQTVSYSSDGAASSGEPKVIRTSSGDCGAGAAPVAKPNAVTPTRAAPAPKAAPRVTPVSAPAPITTFTPSRT